MQSSVAINVASLEDPPDGEPRGAINCVSPFLFASGWCANVVTGSKCVHVAREHVEFICDRG